MPVTQEDLVVTISADAKKAVASLKLMNDTLDDIALGMAKSSKAADKTNTAVTGMGAAFVKAAGAIDVARAAFQAMQTAVDATVGSFIEFEKAQVGVQKTTNITKDEIGSFSREVQMISERIPVASNELLGLAQSAGQLGVSGRGNLLNFAETMAKVATATDLTGDTAAAAFTRILTATNTPIDQIDEFASVVVQLGNNFAATESEITRVATEVARSTAAFGLGADQVAGISTALKQLGIQAQLGGSVVGKTMRTLDDVTRDATGEMAKALEALTGEPIDKLRKTFEQDATAAFNLFIQGLDKVGKSGGSVSQALEQFGLTGDEVNKILPVLASRSDILGEALSTASEEFKNATALNDEAAKAFDTLGARIDVLRNTLTNAATGFGQLFAPAIRASVDSLQAAAAGISNFLSALNQVDFSKIVPAAKALAVALAAVIATMKVVEVVKFARAIDVELGKAIRQTAKDMMALAKANMAAAKSAAAAIAPYALLAAKVALVTGAVAAVAAAVEIVIINWDLLVSAGKEVIGIVDGVIQEFTGVEGAVAGMVAAIQSPFSLIKQLVTQAGDLFSGLGTGVSDTFSEAAKTVKKMIQPIIDTFNKVAGGVAKFLGKTFAPITSGLGKIGDVAKKTIAKMDFGTAGAAIKEVGGFIDTLTGKTQTAAEAAEDLNSTLAGAGGGGGGQFGAGAGAGPSQEQLDKAKEMADILQDIKDANADIALEKAKFGKTQIEMINLELQREREIIKAQKAQLAAEGMLSKEIEAGLDNQLMLIGEIAKQKKEAAPGQTQEALEIQGEKAAKQISDAFGPFLGAVSMMQAPLSAAQGVVDAIPNLLGGATNLITSFGALPDMISDGLDSFIDALTKFPEMLEGFIDKIPEIAIKLIDFLINDAPRIALKLVDVIVIQLPLRLFKGIIKLFSDAAKAFLMALQGKFEMPKFDAGKMEKDVSKVIKKLSGSTAQLFAVEDLAEKAQSADVGKEAQSSADKIANQLNGSALSFVAQMILGALAWKAIIEAGGILWEEAGRLAGLAWDGIVSLATTAWENAGTWAAEAWDSIVSLATTAWEAAGTAAGELWDGIVSLATTAWETAGTVAAEAWDGIVSLATTAWESAGTLAADAWNGIVSAATTAWETAGDVAAEAWDSVVGAATTAWETAGDVAAQAWDGVVSLATTAWEAAGSVAATAWEVIVTAATTAWEVAGATAGAVWEAIVIAGGVAWTAVQAVAGAAFNLLTTAGATIWSAIVVAGATTASALMTGGMTLVVLALAAIFERSGGFGKMKAFFQKLPEKMKKGFEQVKKVLMIPIKLQQKVFKMQVEMAKKAANAFKKILTSAGEALKKLASSAGKALSKPIKSVINQLKKIIGKVKKAVPKGGGGAAKKAKKIFGFSEGGPVPGRGNEDTVPALLTPGEFVVTKAGVSRAGADALSALNAGKMGMASGGATNVTINMPITIDNRGTPVDENFVRQRIMPTIQEEMKRASIEGRLVISSRGIEEI